MWACFTRLVLAAPFETMRPPSAAQYRAQRRTIAISVCQIPWIRAYRLTG
jgi:hypothetical protein